MPLHQVISERRAELLVRWATRVRASFVATADGEPLSSLELIDRMPLFIGELVCALAPEVAPLPAECSPNAEEHGVQRLRLGFDIGEVVREYGILHVAILELAEEAGVKVTEGEAKILATALNRGTADAVTQYQWQRDGELQRQAAEHLGFIAHELRNPLANAQLAFSLLSRREAEGSKPAQRLGRALNRLSSMIDNALSHSWLKVGAPVRGEAVDLLELIGEILHDAADEAEAKRIAITTKLEPIVVTADPRLMSSAISNLVRNALKFSKPGTMVAVRARRQQGRVLIEVEDGCGGLPPGKTDELFSPFVQKGADRTGFGLGLAIARQAAESHNGTITVRNLAGKGCVFAIEIPEVAVPPGA